MSFGYSFPPDQSCRKGVSALPGGDDRGILETWILRFPSALKSIVKV